MVGSFGMNAKIYDSGNTNEIFSHLMLEIVKIVFQAAYLIIPTDLSQSLSQAYIYRRAQLWQLSSVATPLS